jgi:hypothetical protein
VNKLIAQTGVLYQGAGNERAEWIIDGSPVNAIEAARDVDQLTPPIRKIESFLILTNGTRVTLPFNGLAYRIPDHTGAISIFEPGQYLDAAGEDMFPRPNNAAIFNADGSLRCQLHFAGEPARNKDLIIERLFTRRITHKTLPIGRTGNLIDPPIVQFGVLVGTKEDPPESFYILDTETGELTDGLYSVPY